MWESDTAAGPLRWLFLDLNSYFASVEQQLNPALRRRPIAVSPVATDSTCAIAASYEAKAFGIKTGTPIWEAKKLCPELIVVGADHEKYVEFHQKILAEIDRHIPVTEICSIDEMACRLMDNENAPEQALDLARRIKRGIARNVGVCLRSSIGIAPNKFLAKVATDLEKPDGLVMLRSEDLPGRLFDLTLRDLPGIGPNMERRLAQAGVRDLPTLWNLPAKQARKVWGSVEGERFWMQLRGFDLPARETHKSTIGHSHVLAPEMRQLDQARLVARRLTAKAASRMRRDGFCAGLLALGVRMESPMPDGKGPKWTGETRIAPTQDSFALLAALEGLWQRMRADCPHWDARKVSVTLSRLTPEGGGTADLFAASGQAAARQRLSAAMDRLNKKHGRDTVMVGVVHPTQRATLKDAFTGTKIAFTRIPDLEEFSE